MEKRKRRWGDRKEGRRLRTLHPMSYVAPYIMKDRSGAQNLFADSFDIITEVSLVVKTIFLFFTTFYFHSVICVL